ncbi:hypothetical protein [Actinoplanes sp. M2I2]|uniref:hypothetical protein n=1 Tax=Actinoplanes sp. M2I2 TaxID=1734444 RepID=UPI002021AA25|nr:hypothetical protein [Actinoplanes sp. M2I2]
MPGPAARPPLARRVCRALVLTVAVLPGLASAALPGPATAMPPDRAPAFEPYLTETEGWPGDPVVVNLEGLPQPMTLCRVHWEGKEDEATSCEGRTATIAVPDDAPPGPATLSWQVEHRPGVILNLETPEPQPDAGQDPDVVRTSGKLDYTVRGVDATADRDEATPGASVDVTFRPVGGVRITDCGVSEPSPMRCPPKSRSRSVRIAVPSDATPGGDLTVRWQARSVLDGETHPSGGSITVRIVALPPIEFDVRGQADVLGPGQPFVATFVSLTPGVTVTGCGLTLGDRAGCGASDVAVVRVPPGTPSGRTLVIPWDLTYTSKRPGEEPGTAKGELTLRVLAEPSEMEVSVQPASAHPGQEVMLTFVSLRPRVAISGCLVFFPRDAGAFCRQSSKRWFARTRVPADAVPGASLLRWGVESISVDGQVVVDKGTFAFTVRAHPPEPTSGGPTPEPSPTVVPDPVHPSRDRPEPTVIPPTVPPAPTPDRRQPTFAAGSDPESSAPGQAVTVSLAALTDGTTITGCTAGFRDAKVSACRATGAATRSARLLVPASAEPGDRPLDWKVTWRDTTGRTGEEGGTIAYRVSDPDRPATPAFRVQVTPPKAKPGDRVTVLHSALDDGVTITGCHAEFGAGGGAPADCRNTPQGWTADVTVPENAPGGTGAVLWDVAYDRAGPATADGFTRLEVLPVADPGFWSRAAGFGGRIALGFAALAGFVAYRGLAGRLRERFKQGRARTGPAELPEGVRVVATTDAGVFHTELTAPARESRPAIRLVPAPGPRRITLREEPP